MVAEESSSTLKFNFENKLVLLRESSGNFPYSILIPSLEFIELNCDAVDVNSIRFSSNN